MPHWSDTWALLLDGRIVEIRPTGPDDLDEVEQLHASMSQDNQRLRFRGWSRLAPHRAAVTLCAPPDAQHCALGAWLGGRLIGVGEYERADVDAPDAEVAFAVADDAHQLGVATLLLEHLAARAREAGVRRLTAEVAATNAPMLRVFADAGLTTTTLPRGSTVTVAASLDVDEPYLGAVAERERSSQVASLQSILAPRSVVVVGASDRPGSVGGAVVRNLRRAGFAGRLAVVNPHTTELPGVTRVSELAALDFQPDLVVVSVAPTKLHGVVESCGWIGARSVVVLTANVAPDIGRLVRESCRHHGMRLVGPNCLGVATPALGLDATFGPHLGAAGSAGIAVQSGGIGIAATEQMSRLGIGVSTFVSLGDKLDVSATDLLHYWYADESTQLAILYLESFGNPRKFVRVARRLADRIPILALDAGHSEAARLAAERHTAAAATPLATRTALFAEAGVIAVPDIAALTATAALLAVQPPPTGRGVAVLSNAAGMGVLAADALVETGLELPAFAKYTADTLERLLPKGASIANPVDLSAVCPAATMGAAVAVVAADPNIDAVVVLPVPTAVDFMHGQRWPATPVPLVVVRPDQPERVTMEPQVPTKSVPAYDDPRDAAHSLARAADYEHWRRRQRRPASAPPALDLVAARAAISTYLTAQPGGGWLGPREAVGLIAAGGVGPAAMRPADSDLRPTSSPDVEVRVEVTADPTFGPVLTAGLAGAGASASVEPVLRLAPLTAEVADDLSRALLGADPGASTAADDLRDLLVRVAYLAYRVPEIAALELVGQLTAGGVEVVDVAAQVRPQHAFDPYLRRLR